MSLEFKRKKSHNTKWSRKYPRARINNKGGDRKAAIEAGWYKFNWNDDHFNTFNHKLIIRFLKANVGRPINKVFSEFLDKCDSKLRKSYPLKEEFYCHIEKKEDIDYLGGFYVSNGILNYKKSCSKEEYRKKIAQIYFNPLQDYIKFNTANLPSNKDIKELCQKASNTKEPQLLGKLYVRLKYTNCELKDVYIVDSKYPNFWYEPCKILTEDYSVNGVSILFDSVYWKAYWQHSNYKLVTKIKRKTL